MSQEDLTIITKRCTINYCRSINLQNIERAECGKCWCMMAESFEVNANPFTWHGVIGRGRFLFTYALFYVLTALITMTFCMDFIKTLTPATPRLEALLSGNAPLFSSVAYVLVCIAMMYLLTALYAKRFNDIFAKSEKRELIVACYTLVMAISLFKSYFLVQNIFDSLFVLIVLLICVCKKGAVTSQEKSN